MKEDRSYFVLPFLIMQGSAGEMSTYRVWRENYHARQDPRRTLLSHRRCPIGGRIR